MGKGDLAGRCLSALRSHGGEHRAGQKLGYAIPPFDFRLPGVTSLSVDTRKYGYAAKGTSVVLYRGAELRHYQYYTAADWPGGLYFSPTFARSRPGALSAACWAALIAIGEQGYLDATKKILETAAQIRQGIAAMPELRVLGDPLWAIAFTSDTLDIYRIMDCMAATIPFRGMVSELLKRYIDLLYKV